MWFVEVFRCYLLFSPSGRRSEGLWIFSSGCLQGCCPQAHTARKIRHWLKLNDARILNITEINLLSWPANVWTAFSRLRRHLSILWKFAPPHKKSRRQAGSSSSPCFGRGGNDSAQVLSDVLNKTQRCLMNQSSAPGCIYVLRRPSLCNPSPLIIIIHASRFRRVTFHKCHIDSVV